MECLPSPNPELKSDCWLLAPLTVGLGVDPGSPAVEHNKQADHEIPDVSTSFQDYWTSQE